MKKGIAQRDTSLTDEIPLRGVALGERMKPHLGFLTKTEVFLCKTIDNGGGVC